MKPYKTKDGTLTFLNEEVDETYHSHSGAKEEAIKKYVEPSGFISFVRTHSHVNLLDFCFGLGYNSAAAIDAIRKHNPDCRITIIALENDKNIINKIQEIDYPFGCRDIMLEVSRNNSYDDGRVGVRLFLADARARIKEIDTRFDFVFFDPFSPAKCPDMWTKEIFEDIAIHMNDGGMLATYTCARKVRENLRSAGFEVKDGPFVGRYAPSTLAIFKY